MQVVKSPDFRSSADVRVDISNTAQETDPIASNEPKAPITYNVKWSIVLSSVYIFSSIIFLLSVRHSRNLERLGLFSYDSTFTVLCVELAKIFLCILLKRAEDGDVLPRRVLFGDRRGALWRSSVPYVLPALLYALYNNLTYYNLSRLDPLTVQMFLQSRILFTGALFTVVWGHALTKRQWLALTLLTVGLVVKYVSPNAVAGVDGRVVVVFLQALLSSLAGVYNEYAFKRYAQVSIHQQNFFMYLYGIIFNLMLGMLLSPEKYFSGAMFQSFHPIVILIVTAGVINGLSASLILKFIDVIVKAFASAAEVLIMAVAASVVFGDPLNAQNYIAAVFLMCAVYMYYTKGYLSGSLPKNR